MKTQIALAVCLTGMVSIFAQDVTDPDAIPEVRTQDGGRVVQGQYPGEGFFVIVR